MKKNIFVLVAALFLASPAFAQQAGPKVLVVMRDGLDTRLNFGFALWHVVQLKKGGVDVRVVFEGESILNLLGEGAVKKYSDMRNPVFPVPAVSTRTLDGATILVSSASVGPAAPTQSYQDPAVKARKYRFGAKQATETEQIASLLADLKREIPYEVCALSAAMMGIEADIRAAGLPVSADAGKPVDVSKYIKDGYQVIVW